MIQAPPSPAYKSGKANECWLSNTFIPVVQPAITVLRQVYSILKANKASPLASWGVRKKNIKGTSRCNHLNRSPPPLRASCPADLQMWQLIGCLRELLIVTEVPSKAAGSEHPKHKAVQPKACKQSTVGVSGDLASVAKLLVCPWTSYLTYLCLISSPSQLRAALSNKTINALDALIEQGNEWCKSVKLILL